MSRAGDQQVRRNADGSMSARGSTIVTPDPAVMLTTVLGSCVAMCLRDPVRGVGGMNHFLLPDGAGSGTDVGRRRYGAYAMEVLINDVPQRRRSSGPAGGQIVRGGGCSTR